MTVQDLILNNLFGFVGVAILFFILRNYLPNYLQEKGKNLATKEDINEITRIVEGVKKEFSNELELLRLELTKKANIHRLVAEREVNAIYDISEGLINLRMATVGLRPVLDHFPSNTQDRDEMFDKRYQKWAENHDNFFVLVERMRLFLPRSIYDHLLEIKAISVEEGVSFQTDSRYARSENGFTFEQYEKSSSRISSLLKSIDRLSERINERYEIENLTSSAEIGSEQP